MADAARSVIAFPRATRIAQTDGRGARMKTKTVLLAILCAAVLALAAAAQDDAAEKKVSSWKPEDMVMTESASQWRISPDGKWAVYVKSVADREKDSRPTNLFLTSLTEKKEIQLTRGTESHSQPRWAPGGELIAFVSARPRPNVKPDQARAQLWLMSPFGGEPWHLTEFERGIRGFEWVDDDTILFSAEEDPTLYEREIKQKKDDTRVVEDAENTPPVRLYRLAVKTRKVTRLTQNDDWIQSWTASSDGKFAVAVHRRSLAYQWDQKIPPVTFLHNLETGEARQILTEGRIRPFNMRWARDNSGFYVAYPFGNHPEFLNATITLLLFYDVASGQATPVSLDWGNGLASGLEVTSDGFLALLADGAYFRFARYTRSGDTWRAATVLGEHGRHVFGFAVSDDARTLVYNHSTASQPAQWFRASLDGARIGPPTQVTDLNAHLKNKVFARTELIRWTGALNETVEGMLHYPHDYQEGKRYPLILDIHGGPTGVDMDNWSDNWGSPLNLINQRGAFVLRPNYHGSGNYGLKWAESICCGKYYELEIPDMDAGVDYLIARGMVDPDRVATMGWSNGSILSIQLLVENPERYKVASVGAGDVEWISDWANVDFGHAFDKYYFGASPLEDPQLYIRKSPLFRLDRVKAPTLIFFGTEDRNVPTSQGWTHYRALYHLDQAPVRFLLFPGAAHSPQKLTHQVRKVSEEMAWFDRYFFKTEAKENPAFRKDSPLGMALRRKSITTSGTLYGEMHRPAGVRGRAAQPVLIPEVVTRGALEIGRFEVTRAQYAAFDRNYRIEPGTENHPANGITFEQARAYAAWLSQLTGQMWRLPDEGEVAALYTASAAENTLDYWAGYPINPDDAARLVSKIGQLGDGAPLLKAVGSFRGAGGEDEELVFDLGGNVAEWVVTPGGAGKTLGGSADQPADAKLRTRAPAAAYIGFRIVRGETKE